tara:strand:- start:50 stop:571 length:522 start_codon:yes stop_codon:yes gene_type:complete
MALPPRRVGETQEQYSRRIGRNPRTIGGRRRRRLVDPIVGTPTRRKRPTVDPRRRRRRLTAEQLKKLKEFRAKNPMPKQVKGRRMTIQEQGEKALERFNKSRTRKPLTPEQRKKIQESMEGGRRRFREVLKRAGVLRRPKTTRGTASARYRGRPKRVTRGTVTAPVRKQRRPR